VTLSQKTTLEHLQGQIERITYTNEQNGYTVAKIKVHGRRDLVTVIGYMTSPLPGQVLKKMKGEWINHPKFGEQFKAVYCECLVPATSAGPQRYLGSGLVKGIGDKHIEMIKKAWEEQKEIREVILFLQGHGVSATCASKIFKAYGKEAIQVVQENP
jgi:exodeoxyribonuclease V alpha subunit